MMWRDKEASFTRIEGITLPMQVPHLGRENCLRCCICLLASSVASMFFSLKLRRQGRETREGGKRGRQGRETQSSATDSAHVSQR